MSQGGARRGDSARRALGESGGVDFRGTVESRTVDFREQAESGRVDLREREVDAGARGGHVRKKWPGQGQRVPFAGRASRSEREGLAPRKRGGVDFRGQAESGRFDLPEQAESGGVDLGE